MNEEKLIEVIADTFDIDEEDVNPGLDNQTLANWDSLNHLRLVTALEQAFGVSLSMEEINSMHSYDKIVEYVGKHTGG